ncbi:MAG: sodium-dependent transporter [Bdellovibrionales bacterium]|nr:sodium-dependent transporter [Bdellovibrionales bacterium]
MKVRVWMARLGFFLALVSSASGLGNLWRFPYVVADNGGGGFVLLYLLLVLIIGLPLLIGELLVGRVTGKSILASIEFYKKGKLSPHLGNLSMFVCLLVLGYFSVISSWVLFFFFKFLIAFVTGDFFDPQMAVTELTNNGWIQIALTALHISLCIAIVGKEVEEGLEKFVGYLMPIFAVMLCILVWQSMSLDSSEEALRFLFYPNFSQLKWSSLSSALGQVLFTLSIGFTTMVTFGSMLPKDTNVPQAGIGISLIDSVTSLLAGMLIFPLLVATPFSDKGPLMLFKTVPEFFSSFSHGPFWGLTFFLLLYLGAFGASIGILETLVVNFKQGHYMSRIRASVITGVISFLISLLPALATSYLKDIKIMGMTILVLWDSLLVNWILPVIALLMALWIYYAIPKDKKFQEFMRKDLVKDDYMFKHWLFMLKWVVPLVTFAAFALSLIGLFV